MISNPRSSITFNRTIEELKWVMKEKDDPRIITFNRTIEELKFTMKKLSQIQLTTFNRTIEELKCGLLHRPDE